METIKVWDGLGWAPLPPDENIDGVPEELMPKDGCPICKSAWLDVLAVGFVPPVPTGDIYHRSTHYWLVRTHAAPAMASVVRLRCCGDHVTDHHAVTGEWRKIWTPGQTALTTLGIHLGILAVVGYGALFAHSVGRQ